MLIAVFFTACDDSTSGLGIVDDSDNIVVSQAGFSVQTRSLKADSVIGSNTTCYLGKITDPETNSIIKADFLAQFHTFENYELPSVDSIVKNEYGKIEADSIEVRLYYRSFYGDSLNAMKLSVYELDTLNAIREDSVYHTDLNLAQFVNPNRSTPLVKKMFSVRDLTVEDAILDGENYVKNIRILLPKEYGTFILRKYYENKDFFKNSYNFIRHVCPGFYFKLEGGEGTMLYMNVSSLNVYFRYHENDSVIGGVSRFAATPEVIQSTHIENLDMPINNGNENYTYLKTPAGIYTEMTLPIEDIYKGHERDSVNSAKIIFTKYNNQSQSKYPLGTPKSLLMVRKKDLYSFFRKKKVSDSKTSYTSYFNASFNNYTFSNIAQLIAFCKTERNMEAAKQGITLAEWEARNPDWNKVVLVPVNIVVNSYKQEISVSYDLGMNSIRLVGGTEPVNIQIIYSRFSK